MNKTYKVVWILMSVIGWILPCLSSKLPIVRVDSGQIAGSYGNTYNGRQFYSFLGIPYARPPVQDYRFKVLKRVETIVCTLCKSVLYIFIKGTTTSKTMVRHMERYYSWK